MVELIHAPTCQSRKIRADARWLNSYTPNPAKIRGAGSAHPREFQLDS